MDAGKRAASVGSSCDIGSVAREPGTEAVERGSWWFKIDRARRHLDEAERYASRYEATRPYRYERETDGYWATEFVVRAYLIDPPDFELSTILGDFFFNLRSALDHLAVALVPAERGRKAAFPIFTTDPRPPKSNGHNTWRKSIDGMPQQAVSVIESLQPFLLHDQHPELDHLAILDQFAQADKHRELVAFARYLLNPVTTILGQDAGTLLSQTRPGAYGDGGIVAYFPLAEPLDETDATVHVHGSIEIGIRRIGAAGDFVFPGTLRALLDYVTGSVIPPLERLVANS